MLEDIKHLYGRKLGATDGDIGHIKDFYFDDKTWKLRYIVADTGSWLSGRQVLLSPDAFGAHAFGKLEMNTDVLRVNLTRKQIEDSPSIDSHRPVSRQYEEDYYRYYGWPAYWSAGGVGGIGGVSGFPGIAVPIMPAIHPVPEKYPRADLHLRSARATAGYQVDAIDGKMGSLSSFMVDGKTWTIHDLAIETGHWYAGKTILIPTRNVLRIGYEDSTVFIDFKAEDLRRTEKYEIAHHGTG